MSKYRTVIELVCEAEDRHEAVDMAGEYLRGSLKNGVSMKFWSRPVMAGAKVLCVSIISIVLLGAGVLKTTFSESRNYRSHVVPGYNACQAPLLTGAAGAARSEFEERWKDKEFTRAIETIKS